MHDSEIFFPLNIWIFYCSIIDGEIKVSILVQFLGYWLLKFAFTKTWIFIRRLCFGSTNCHFNVTYWSCRQPASHKSCKVPENMIYELSYGKWGLLIFLTLQNVVTYQSLSSWLNQSCFHSKCSLFPPLIWAFAHFTLTHEKCVTFLSSLSIILDSNLSSAVAATECLEGFASHGN